jgi:imidazolonepropionase-like amidohydrolase
MTAAPLRAVRGASLRIIALVAAALLCTAPAAPAQGDSSAVLFRDARVFDGVRMLERQDVLVGNGRISRMGRNLRARPGTPEVDASGRTLMPGLIDAHTHTMGDGLREAVMFGVTTHLDMFTDVGFARAMKTGQGMGAANGRADLFTSGTLVTSPGGHGTQFGMPIPTITSPDSAQAFVDARIAEGSDWIKIVYDDGHAVGITFRSIDRRTMRAVIDAAHRRGKLAVVHITDAASARAAVEEGADGLVHLFIDEVDPDFARLVAERRAFVIPTTVVLRSMTGTGGGAALLDDPRIAPYLLPSRRASLAQGFPSRPGTPARTLAVPNATIRQLRDRGATILAGSDAPNPGTAFGAALHGELELLVQAGLTPIEALRAATSAPAMAFRLSDRGRIAPGLRADLVLVEGDPSRDITRTRSIVGVWKGGFRVDREAFARSAASAREAHGRGAAGLADGLVSGFDDGRIAAALGSWMASRDDIAGGASTGELRVVAGGAQGSRHALQVAGTISNAVPYAWYGPMWTPGPEPMSPVDLSATPNLSFWARGDGGTYRVMVFAQSRGMTPLTRTFTAGPEWTEVKMTWADFGIRGNDVLGIVFAGGPGPGGFEFQLDQFRLR